MTTFIWDTRPKRKSVPSPEAVRALGRYHSRTRRVPAADRHGHRTRMSDSSVYDEVCLTCGATDAGAPNDRLSAPCPQAVPEAVVEMIQSGNYQDRS